MEISSPLSNYAVAAAQEVLQSRYHSKYTVLWRLALETGYRISDLLGVRRCDIGDTLTLVERKTGKTRSVKVPIVTRLLVDAYANQYRIEPDAPLIYSGEDRRDKPISRIQAYRVLRDVGKEIGVALSPHSLRKTYAVRIYHATKSLLAARDALNHSHVGTTALYVYGERDRPVKGA